MSRRLSITVSAAMIGLASLTACAPKPREQRKPTVPVAKQRALYEALLAQDPTAPYDVALPPGSPALPVNPENPRTKAGVQLGRWLFYDPILSRDHTMSCASCHQQAKAFTDGRRFSPGIRGEHVGFNAMSLVNLAWGTRFFWDGRAPTLEAQALQPIQNAKELDQPLPKLVAELQSHPVYPDLFRLAFGDAKVTEERIGKALAQFVGSLVSFSSPLDEIRRVEAGLKKEEDIDPELRPLLLSKADPATRSVVALCGKCHNGTGTYGQEGHYSALYGGTRVTSNGLDEKPLRAYGAVTGKPEDDGHFRVPDLRNVALTAPYMHDGRFATLEEVLEHYDHGIRDFPGLDPALRGPDGQPKRLNLSPEVKANVLRYLRLMTDTDFVNNEDAADPFR